MEEGAEFYPGEDGAERRQELVSNESNYKSFGVFGCPSLY